MTVYVDDFRVYAPSRIRCFKNGSAHLTADHEDELHDFAHRLGLRRAWFQPGPPDGTASHPHYDLTHSKYALALSLGATLVPAREQAKRRLAAKRKERPCTCDADVHEIHDMTSSWKKCTLCRGIWDLRSEGKRPPLATNLRGRCRSFQYSTDLSVPFTVRCVFVKNHDGRHEDPFGFHWREGVKPQPKNPRPWPY